MVRKKKHPLWEPMSKVELHAIEMPFSLLSILMMLVKVINWFGLSHLITAKILWNCVCSAKIEHLQEFNCTSISLNPKFRFTLNDMKCTFCCIHLVSVLSMRYQAEYIFFRYCGWVDWLYTCMTVKSWCVGVENWGIIITFPSIVRRH